MAHIVARSPDGPRGAADLATAQRDEYENLILLCPNDHSRIDSDVDSWPVAELHRVKAEHEEWVDQRLSAGTLEPVVVDTLAFREDRVARWAASTLQPWLVVAFTPLQLIEDAIDPLQHHLRYVVRGLRLPLYLSYALGPQPQAHHIEPSARGLLCEDYRKAEEGLAYRVEVLRNGHIEYAILFRELAERASIDELRTMQPYPPTGIHDNRAIPGRYYLEYGRWAESVRSQFLALSEIRTASGLAARDVVVTSAFVGIREMSLLVMEGLRKPPLVGRPADEDQFVHSFIPDREASSDEIAETALKRLVNGFGLALDRAFDSSGDPVLPRQL